MAGDAPMDTWEVRLCISEFKTFPLEEVTVEGEKSFIPVFLAGDGGNRRKWHSVELCSDDRRLQASWGILRLEFQIRGTDNLGNAIAGSQSMYPLQLKDWARSDSGIKGEIQVTSLKASKAGTGRGANRPWCHLCVQGFMGTFCVFETFSECFLVKSKCTLTVNSVSMAEVSASSLHIAAPRNRRAREHPDSSNTNNHKAKRIRGLPSLEFDGGGGPSAKSTTRADIIEGLPSASTKTYPAIILGASILTDTNHGLSMDSADSGVWPFQFVDRRKIKKALNIYESRIDIPASDQLSMNRLLAAIMNDLLRHDGGHPLYSNATLEALELEIYNCTPDTKSSSPDSDPETSDEESSDSDSGEGGGDTNGSLSSSNFTSLFSGGSTNTANVGPTSGTSLSDSCNAYPFAGDRPYDSDGNTTSTGDDAVKQPAKCNPAPPGPSAAVPVLESGVVEAAAKIKAVLANEYRHVGFLQEPKSVAPAITAHTASHPEAAPSAAIITSGDGGGDNEAVLRVDEAAVSSIRRTSISEGELIKSSQDEHKCTDLSDTLTNASAVEPAADCKSKDAASVSGTGDLAEIETAAPIPSVRSAVHPQLQDLLTEHFKTPQDLQANTIEYATKAQLHIPASRVIAIIREKEWATTAAADPVPTVEEAIAIFQAVSAGRDLPEAKKAVYYHERLADSSGSVKLTSAAFSSLQLVDETEKEDASVEHKLLTLPDYAKPTALTDEQLIEEQVERLTEEEAMRAAKRHARKHAAPTSTTIAAAPVALPSPTLPNHTSKQ